MKLFVDHSTLLEDDIFPDLSDLLEDFLTPQVAQGIDPFDDTRSMAMFVDQLKLSIPIELQTLRDERNHFALGTSLPTQWIDTTVQPVLHQLRITLELDHENEGKQSMES